MGKIWDGKNIIWDVYGAQFCEISSHGEKVHGIESLRKDFYGKTMGRSCP